MRRSVINT
jgi:hypothetical protein